MILSILRLRKRSKPGVFRGNSTLNILFVDREAYVLSKHALTVFSSKIQKLFWVLAIRVNLPQRMFNIV